MRRERLERIATAERDRRAGRVELAVAAIGEPAEWPARVVLALAHLSGSESEAARRLLEEGLDLWAGEMGLAPLDGAVPTPEAMPEREAGRDEALGAHLDRPFDSFELDRAFAEAKTQTEEMRSVNHVAERILMDEPVGLAEISDEPLVPIEALEPEPEPESGVGLSVEEEMDAAFVAGEAGILADSIDVDPMVPTRSTASPSDFFEGDPDPRRPSRAAVLATLERWLRNLERQREERVQ